MNYIINTLIKAAFILSLVMGQASFVMAEMKLSITTEDGSNVIRFGRVGLPTTLNKEVNFRITSDDEVQYQIFQRLSGSFVNESGESIFGDVLTSAALPNSNSVGSLELQNAEHLGMSEQLIYTSSVGGLSDSFTLVYQVNTDEVTGSGEYNGDIIYTLRPIGEGFQEEIVLKAYFDLSGELSIKAQTSSGSDYIKLNAGDSHLSEEAIQFTLEGNRAADIRVYQQFIEFPRNELGKALDEQVLKFFTSGGELGILDYQEPNEPDPNRLLIYATEEPEDNFSVHFTIDDEEKHLQKAGIYLGKIQYEVEQKMEPAETFSFDLEIEIPPVFELVTEFPPEGVSFEGLLPTSDPQLKEVMVTVKSNLGKPYVVNQRVVGMLSNEAGQVYDENFFNVMQEVSEGTAGRVSNDDFVSVTEGDSTLFYSDSDGSSSQFKVIYRLQPYAKMLPGDYKMAVMYSLSET